MHAAKANLSTSAHLCAPQVAPATPALLQPCISRCHSNSVRCRRYMNGKFPYPFMNQMHPAVAFFSMLVLSIMVMHVISLIGVAISSVSRRALSKPDVLAQPPTNGHSAVAGKNGKNGTAPTHTYKLRQRAPKVALE